MNGIEAQANKDGGWSLLDSSVIAGENRLSEKIGGGGELMSGGLPRQFRYLKFMLLVCLSVALIIMTAEAPVHAQTQTITISTTSTSITEGDSGTKNVPITITLSEPTSGANVAFRIVVLPASTATVSTNTASTSCSAPQPANADFCYGGPPREFGSRYDRTSLRYSATKTYNLKIIGDTDDEEDETIKVLVRGDDDGHPGWKKNSNTLTITITDDDGTTTNPPAKPTGLTATAGNAQVMLSWTDPNDDSISKWQVRYTTRTSGWPSSSWEDITGSDADTTSHTVTGLTNDSPYRFQIRAVGSGGDGASSNEVTATPTAPTAPVVLTKPKNFAAAPGNGQVVLTWDDPQNAAITVWELNQKKGSDSWSGWTAISGSTATTTTHTVPNLDNGSTYQFRLRAKAGVAPSPYAQATAMLRAPTVAGVTISTAALTVAEGASGTYTVKLDKMPTSDVTVTVAGMSGDVTVSGSPLTFTTVNYGTPQTVTVSAATDTDTATDPDVTLTHSASGRGYGAVTIASVVVSITENTPLPMPTLTLATDPAPVTEGSAISLVVTADRAVSGTLQVKLTLAARGTSGFDAADVSGTLGPRDFAAAFSGGRQATVSIPTVSDMNTEGAETYRITLTAGTGYAVGSDVEADGTLNDAAADASAAAPANMVHSAVLPQIAGAVMSQTLNTVLDRVTGVAGGVPGGDGVPFRGVPRPSGLERLDGSRSPVVLSERQATKLLDGATFNLQAEGAGSSGVPALWGQGDWTSLKGSEGALHWDGELRSLHLGGDLHVRDDVLVGAAVSRTVGDLDAENGGVQSTYETALTAVQPYVAWMAGDGAHLWGSIGYGEGKVRLREAAMLRQTDLTWRSAAVGGRYVLRENARMMDGGTTRLAVKGWGSTARLRTVENDGLVALTLHTTRLRVMLEGSHEQLLDDDRTLTASLEAGARYDDGDLGRGAGLEVGGGVRWRNAVRRLTSELRVRTLVDHEQAREEWGASLLLRYEPQADGSGTAMSLRLSRGQSASDFDWRLASGRSADATSDASAVHLEAEVSHGLRMPGAGALLSPYAGLRVPESGSGMIRLGTRYRLRDEFSLGLAMESRPGEVAVDGISLQGALYW